LAAFLGPHSGSGLGKNMAGLSLGLSMGYSKSG